MTSYIRLCIIGTIVSPLIWASAYGEDQKSLKIYSSRKTHLLEPLTELYSKKTGVAVQVINGKAGVLIERIKREGAKSPADVFMTVDAGTLWYAGEQGLLASLKSPVLEKAVPKAYRDSKNRWFGLSLRARTLFYNKNKIKAEDLTSYEDLAQEKFKGKLCLRTSRKVYNQSLVASLIDRLGETSTKKVVEGWVGNLAKPVFTSDTLLLEAIDRGQCDVGVANTYYFARLQKKGKGKNVRVFWPNQKNPQGQAGVHVNISGGGVVKTSSQKAQGQKFLEFLTSTDAQNLFAKINDEYPVREGVAVSEILKGWGEFTKDSRSMEVFGVRQKQAIRLMDKAQYR